MPAETRLKPAWFQVCDIWPNLMIQLWLSFAEMFGIRQHPKRIRQGHMEEHADTERNRSAALVLALDTFRAPGG